MLTCAITALAGLSQHWQAYHSTGRPITALAGPSQHWQAYHSTGRPITALAGLSQHWQAYHSTFHTQWVSELYRCIFPFSQQRTIAHRNKHQLSSCIYTQIFTGVLAAPAGTSRTARTSETSSHNLFLAVAYSNTEKQTQAVMVYILKCLLASLQHCVTAQTIHRHIIRCSGSLEYSYNTGKQTSAVVVY